MTKVIRIYTNKPPLAHIAEQIERMSPECKRRYNGHLKRDEEILERVSLVCRVLEDVSIPAKKEYGLVSKLPVPQRFDQTNAWELSAQHENLKFNRTEAQ